MRGFLNAIVFILALGGLIGPGLSQDSDVVLEAPEIVQPFLDGAIFPVDERMSLAPTDDDAELAQACCRYCCTGKPCGNSCINRNLTCHQPPGCACWGC